MTKGATIRGADTLARTMGKAAAALDDLTETNRRVAQQVAADAASRAPRRTGALAASLRGTADAQAAHMGSGLVYAPVIHYGWPAHGISANPFLTDTVDDRTTTITTTYRHEVEAIVNRIKGA